MSNKPSKEKDNLESAFATGLGIGIVEKVADSLLQTDTESKRTYDNLGNAIKGAYRVLDPEEQVAIRHVMFFIFLMGLVLGNLGEIVSISFAIMAMVYHIGKTHLASRRGNV